MPVVPSRAVKASWLLLDIPRSAQTTLLKLRTLASDLTSHIPERAQRKKNNYAESFCPLCARAVPVPADADMYEDLHHLVCTCLTLAPQQALLNTTASTQIAQLGGLRLSEKAPPTAWNDLSEGVCTALLLGNPIPSLTFTMPDKHERDAWRSNFLMALLPHTRTLLITRRTHIAHLYPPTSSTGEKSD
jgi:hypothetical protein